MRRWLLVLVLAVAPATAWAQSAPAPTTPQQQVQLQAAGATTAKALAAATAAEKTVNERATTLAAVKAKYDGEKKAVDRLKQQRASWRRDRELRAQLATATETAKQLAQLNSDLAAAQKVLATARRNLVAAIDAELAAGATGTRAGQLAKLKAQVAPPARKVRKIVVPETEIDPLADPEELDQQATALKETEAELQRQMTELEKRGEELDKRAKLAKEHQRTVEIARRENDTPRRGNQTGTTSATGGGRGDDETAAPMSSDSPAPGGPGDSNGPAAEPVPAGDPAGGGTYESDARIELAEVVDESTIDSLARAQRSGDPQVRAEAARKTRDAVKARLEQLKKKRAEIEARAKQLRKK